MPSTHHNSPVRPLRRLAAATLWLASGCGVAVPGDLLIEPEAFALDPDLDPFPDHREAHHDCSASGVYEELGGVEIDTGRCDYAVLRWDLLKDVPPGTPVELFLRHQTLSAPEPASAHVALRIGDDVAFDFEVDLPAAPAALRPLRVTRQRARAGDPVVLHLHNHGANTWNLLRLIVADLDGSGPR